MELLLCAPGREYEWTGKKWKKLPYGTYAMELAHRFLVDNHPPVESALPAVSMLLELVRGERTRLVEWWEGCGGLWKDLGRDIALYLSGEEKPLWNIWEGLKPYPYLAKGNKLGWYVRVSDVVQAATAEMCIAYVNRWKPSIKICREHGRLFSSKRCPLCEAGKAGRKEFLNLLRVHRHRYKHLAGEIAQFSDKAVQAFDDSVMRDYLEFCRENNLPTGWLRRRKTATECRSNP